MLRENEDEQVTARLAELARLKIMDTKEDPVLNDLVRTAALITGAPISLLTLIDDKRQWFKAAYGMKRGGSPITDSFCIRALVQEGILIVEDAQADPDYQNNPFVTGVPHIRFYAGVPLISTTNVRYGALCIIDRQPHKTSVGDVLLLQKLAKLAVYEIERNYPNIGR